MKINIIISGTRTFNDYALLEKTLDEYLYKLLPYYEIIIISGDAKGADALGIRYAEEHGLEYIYCSALWRLHGKAAGPRRNEYMAMRATDGGRGVLFAFWDGESRGTKSMIQYAKRWNLEIHIVPYTFPTECLNDA